MTTDDRHGVLTIDGDRATMTFRRHLPHPIEVVWAALTDPAERRAWSARYEELATTYPAGPNPGPGRALPKHAAGSARLLGSIRPGVIPAPPA